MPRLFDQKTTARILNVSPRTLRRWIAAGQFAPARKLPNGERRWLKRDVHEWEKALPKDESGGV